MKNLSVLFLLTGITSVVARQKNSQLVIKKCCPLGQELNYELSCVNITRKFKDFQMKNSKKDEILGYGPTEIIFPSKDFDDQKNFAYSWFPFFSVINSSTLEPVANLESLRKLIGTIDVDYGKRAECPNNEKDTGCFKLGLSEQFRLILYPDQNMRLYISKKSSFHNEANFNVETRDCLSFNEERKYEENIQGKNVESVPEVNELRTFPLEHVCIDRGPAESFFVEYCPCKYIFCLRKCCRDNEVFNEKKGKCTFDPLRGNWRPHLDNSTLNKKYYLLSNNYPSTCKPSFHLQTLESLLNLCKSDEEAVDPKQFYFLADGSLKVGIDDEPLPSNSFCGDNVMVDSETVLKNTFLTCSQKDLSFREIHISEIVAFMSGFFLLLLIFICLCLPELKNSLFSKAIICHNLLIMLGDFILGLNYMLPAKTYNFCIAFNLITQYCFMSSFFWMNIMCFIISIHLRELKEVHKHEIKFLWCGIYGWGAPLIITAITKVLEFIPLLPSSFTKPNFTCHDCASDPDSLAIVIFFYAPMIAVISFNAVLLLCNIIQFREAKKLDRVDGNDSSEKLLNQGRKRLVIFAKLFLIMGFSWVVEIILKTFFLSREFTWLVSDIFTFLRASLIFIMFICRKKIFLGLLKKLKCISEESSDEACQIKKIGFSDELEDMKRRERILRKQITQIFRRSNESLD